MTQEELFLRVCDILHQPTDGSEGMRLAEAIQLAKGGEPFKDSEKNAIRDKLRELGEKQPGSVYFLYNGERYFPGKSRKSPEYVPGKPMTWVVLDKPLDLTPERKALVISIVETYSSHLLPPWERRTLKQLLSKEPQARKPAEWLARTQVLPRYPPLYPNLDQHQEQRESILLKALESEKGVIARYLNGPWHHYFPVKLVRRESVSYVVCYCQELDETREYAIHRFQLSQLDDLSHVKLVDRPPGLYREIERKPQTASVDGRWGTLKYLRIRVSGPPAQHLSEVRFHAEERDAELTRILDHHPTDGTRIDWVELEVRQVNYDYTFKTWLLGLGGYLNILSFEADHSGVDPIRDLREEIAVMAKSLKCTL